MLHASGVRAVLNIVTYIAKEKGRDYITPEDVAEAVKRHGQAMLAIQRSILEVISRTTEFGIKDASLCAFIAINCDNRAGGAADNPMFETGKTT